MHVCVRMCACVRVCRGCSLCLPAAPINESRVRAGVHSPASWLEHFSHRSLNIGKGPCFHTRRCSRSCL